MIKIKRGSVFIIILLLISFLSISCSIFNKKQQSLIAVSRNGIVYKLDSNGEIKEKIIGSKLGGVTGVEIAPDKKSMVIITKPSDTKDKSELLVLDIYKKKVINLNTDLKGELIFISYSPDGRYILMKYELPDSKLSQLLIYNTITEEINDLTAGMEGELSFFHFLPSFLPSGKKVIFRFVPSNLDYSSVWLISIDGSERKNITEGLRGGFIDFKTSPDENKILLKFSIDPFANEELFLISEDLSRRNLTEGLNGKVGLYDFSHLSDSILFNFINDDLSNQYIYSVNLNTYERKNLTKDLYGSSFYKYINISGQIKILFYQGPFFFFRRSGKIPENLHPYQSSLWLMNPDGSGKEKITRDIIEDVFVHQVDEKNKRIIYTSRNPDTPIEWNTYILGLVNKKLINITGDIDNKTSLAPTIFPECISYPDNKGIIFDLFNREKWICNIDDFVGDRIKKVKIYTIPENSYWESIFFSSDNSKVLLSSGQQDTDKKGFYIYDLIKYKGIVLDLNEDIFYVNWF